ncbi:ribosome-binding factor A [Aquihabitans sp. McL0605]|uniref:ribosome-binding factor A n=1 Tax=Aquihabitans sp. McL0605 TaxID=3415671 RepID=UPI003CE96960
MKKRTTARDYPRTARLNTLVRDILARELGRIDDERLEFVTLTSVVVDGDLKKAVAYYDHSRGDEADDEVAEAFDEHRSRLQRSIGREAHIKRTPELRFELDGVLRNAQHIESVIRTLPDLDPGATPVEYDPELYKPDPAADDD